MKQYKADLSHFLHKKSYILCLLAVALLAYGFAAVNITVGIDDLEIDRYCGSGHSLYASGRFATVWWSVLLGYQHDLVANAPIIDMLSVLFFCIAAINYCILFRRITKDKLSMPAYTVFSCLLVSYPLMNEIWEYTGTNVPICGGHILTSFALLLLHDHLHHGTWRKPGKVLLAMLLMMLVCAGYESLVAVYVFFVCALLALQIIYGPEKEKRGAEVLRQGILYAAVLAAGFVLRLAVHQLTLHVLDLETAINGATKITWGTMPASQVILYWLFGWVRDYLLGGIIYFPITELLVAIVVFLVIGLPACHKHGWALLLPGFGMLLSLVLLSLVQGTSPYYRTCQVFAPFVAFVGMMVINWFCTREGRRARALRAVALMLSAYLCFYQAAYLNYFLTLNHVRSEEEAFIVRQIGTELTANFDRDKPVIFVCSYELSDSVREAASIPEDSLRWKLYVAAYQKAYEFRGIPLNVETRLDRHLPQTNVNSVLFWSSYAFKQESMQKLFAYYGYDYVLADYDALLDGAWAYAIENKMPVYPSNGYIQDVGEYIIVRL